MAVPPTPGVVTNRTSYVTVAPQAVGMAIEREDASRTEVMTRFAGVVANAMQGKLNIGGNVTLTGTATTLVDQRIGGQSLLLFMALDSAGAAAIGSIYASSRTKGQVVLGHNSSTATVEYIVVG